MADDGLRVARCTPDDVDDVAAFVAAQQTDPSRHIAYLSLDAAAIAAELAALQPDGLDGTWLARRGEVLVGC